MDLTIHGTLKFLAACFGYFVGIVVLTRNRKSPAHRAFFLLMLTTSTWQLLYSFVFMASSEDVAYDGVRFAYLLAVPYISPSVYFFSVRWTNRPYSRWVLRAGVLSAAVLGLIMFLKFAELCSIVEFAWGKINRYHATMSARFYFAFLLSHFILYAVLALRNFISSYRSAISPNERLQLGNFIIGFFIGYSGFIDFLVARGLNVYPFGYVSFSLFVALIAYTMIYHQFLDIRIALKRITAFAFIYLILSVLIVPIGALIMRDFIGLGPGELWAALSFGTAIGLFFSTGPLIYAFLIRNSFWLRTQLTTGLTHELKSPLSAIQSAIEIVSDQISDLPNHRPHIVNEYLGLIRRNTQRLEDFVRDLLLAAQIDHGDIRVEKRMFDLTELVNSQIDAYKDAAARKAIEIEFEGRDARRIYGDEKKIAQVISNLLANAVRFTESGVVKVDIESAGSAITVTVSDTGIGLQDDERLRIFSRFYHGRHSAGSGLGLAIAKAWVEAHGGRIWAESEGEGKGTTVTFTVPV